MALDPGIQTDRLDLGIVFAQDKQYDRAIAEIQEAIRLDEDRPNPHVWLARVYHEAGRESDAKAERAVVAKLEQQEHQRVLKGYAMSLVYRGDQMVANGKKEEAMAVFLKALESDPDCALASSRVGELLALSGKFDEAIPRLQKALALDPGDAQARDSLSGALALAPGRSSEAIVFTENALRTSPEDAALHVNLAIALYGAGRLDEAIEHLATAAQLRPTDAAIQNNLGTALLSSGRVDEAIPHLEKSVELATPSAEAHYKVGELFGSRGKFSQALVQYRKSLAIDPKYVPALVSTVRLLARSPDASLRDTAEALRLSDELLRLPDGEDPAALAVVAEARAVSGRFDEALQIARRALDLAKARGEQALVDELMGSLRLYRAHTPFQNGQP